MGAHVEQGLDRARHGRSGPEGLTFGTVHGGIGVARASTGIPFAVAGFRLLPSVEGRLLIDGL